MIQKIILLVILAISCENSTKKDINIVEYKKEQNIQIDKCDTKRVTELDKQLSTKTMKYETIKYFLLTISKDCNTNIEFTEFSNETLFKVLMSDPSSILKILEKENIDKQEVYKMLKNPISDEISLNELTQKIVNLKINSIEKDNIIKSLKTALNK